MHSAAAVEHVESQILAASQRSDDDLAATLKALRNDRQYADIAMERFSDVADFYDESPNRWLAFTAQRLLRKRQRQDVKDKVLAINSGDLCGVQMKHRSCEQGAMFLPDASEPGRLRVSFFDERGFFGHVTRDTYAELVDEAVASGFDAIADDQLLTRMSQNFVH